MGTHTWDLTSSRGPYLSLIVLEKLDEVADEFLPHKLSANNLGELTWTSLSIQ